MVHVCWNPHHLLCRFVFFSDSLPPVHCFWRYCVLRGWDVLGAERHCCRMHTVSSWLLWRRLSDIMHLVPRLHLVRRWCHEHYQLHGGSFHDHRHPSHHPFPRGIVRCWDCVCWCADLQWHVGSSVEQCRQGLGGFRVYQSFMASSWQDRL